MHGKQTFSLADFDPTTPANTNNSENEDNLSLSSSKTPTKKLFSGDPLSFSPIRFSGSPGGVNSPSVLRCDTSFSLLDSPLSSRTSLGSSMEMDSFLEDGKFGGKGEAESLKKLVEGLEEQLKEQQELNDTLADELIQIEEKYDTANLELQNLRSTR